MDAVIVRYELDPNRLDEHRKLIDAVFAHLRDERPEGVHYGVLKSADGTQFTHIGIYESDQARMAASENDAFRAFVADIGARCIVPPNAVSQEVIQQYRIFGTE